MKTSNKIAVLILAAGSSTRMGTPKQLLPWKGTTLLGNTIGKALTISPQNVFVVLGAHSKKIKESIDIGRVQYINNPNYKSGLGASLACGIEHLLTNGHNYRGVLILLCDQPLLDSAYFDSMIAAFDKSGKGIIATAYGNRAGVPAFFAQKYFSKLTRLDNDNGARAIIKRCKDDLVVLDAGQKVIDIDTEIEYENLLRDTKN